MAMGDNPQAQAQRSPKRGPSICLNQDQDNGIQNKDNLRRGLSQENGIIAPEIIRRNGVNIVSNGIVSTDIRSTDIMSTDIRSTDTMSTDIRSTDIIGSPPLRPRSPRPNSLPLNPTQGLRETALIEPYFSNGDIRHELKVAEMHTNGERKYLYVVSPSAEGANVGSWGIICT